MASFSNISIRFNADLKQFSSQMQNANRQMQKMGKQMTKVGKNLTIGVTAPIVALGFKAVTSFDKQAKAIAQVEAGIKSTGMAAGFTSKELQKMASDLQNKTIFGDEEILKNATSQLLTFTNIAGDQFGRTQEAALNLATRLDGDLKSASIQLGKALNDPISNLSALSRSGIQFADDQKAMIKALADTGQLAEAQTIILDELEKQYGGAAEAAAKAGLGPFTQLSNIMGDLMEDFGEIITEYLTPFIEKIKGIALRFKELDKSTKKVIVVVAALAAAVGPLLLILGTLMTTVIPGLIAGFTALSLPVLAVVAAIAAVAYAVYRYWPEIKKAVVDLQNYFIDLYNESVAFRVAVQYIVFMFKTWWSVAKAVFGGIWDIIKNLGTYIVDTFKNVGAGIKAALTGDPEGVIKAYKKQAELMGKVFTDSFKDVGDQISTLTDNISRDFNDSIDAVTSKKKIEFVEENIDASAVEKKVKEAVEKGMNGEGGRAKVSTVAAYDAKGIEPMASPLDGLLADLPEKSDLIKETYTGLKDGMINITDELNNALEAGFGNAARHLGNFLGDLASGKAKAQDFFSGLLGVVGSFMESLGQALIAVGVASEAFKNVFASGFGAIAAGVALVALSKVVSNIFQKGPAGQDVPKFADGGLVYGPTLGLMGEYSGANTNPEVIAPLDKLKGMIVDAVGGSGGGDVRFRLQGQELIGLFDRAQGYKNRSR